MELLVNITIGDSIFPSSLQNVIKGMKQKRGFEYWALHNIKQPVEPGSQKYHKMKENGSCGIWCETLEKL